ncbi:MAG: type 4a pilus biogenesis protein PilO [Planctomycetota bacterium]
MLPMLEKQPAWIVWGGGVALAALLTLAAYAWMVVPSRQREAAAEVRAAQIAQERADAEALRLQLAELNQQLRHTRAALEEQPIELGDRRQLNRQIAEIIALAQSQGLEVLQLQPGELMPSEDYALIPLRLDANAAFPQHLEFLQTLHRSFPSVSVVGLELQSQTRADVPRPRATYGLAWFTTAEESTIADATGGG